MATEKNIHSAILEVMSKVGYVQKDGTMGGPGGGYKFAGEAAFIAALRPAMLDAGIFVYPMAVRNVQRSIFPTKNGGSAISTCAEYTFRFTHASSGTFIDVEAVGDGTDMGDKGAYKAATGALKMALRQTNLIETGNDPDEQGSHEQERAAPEAPLPWPQNAQAYIRERKIRFKDIPELRIPPDADGSEVQKRLEDWRSGLKPRPKNDDELLFAFKGICEGVVGLQDAA